MFETNPIVVEAKRFVEDRLLSLLFFFTCMLHVSGAEWKTFVAAAATTAFQAAHIVFTSPKADEASTTPAPSAPAG